MTYPCPLAISAFLTTCQPLSIVDLSYGHLIDTKHVDRYHVLLPIAVVNASITLALAVLLDLALFVCIDLLTTVQSKDKLKPCF